MTPPASQEDTLEPSVRRITLLTDFSTADGYVGAMRGVIASLEPRATVEDVSHEVTPGDVCAAAWALGRYWRLYPEGTVHVVVVDPGVGGARRALAAKCSSRYLVAPDNGVLTLALKEDPSARIVSIDAPSHMRAVVSSTFHGRDVFAPAAAYLAGGGDIDALGSSVTDPVTLPWPKPQRTGSSVKGEVIHVDRFGNLITNIPRAWVEGAEDVVVDGKPIGPVRVTYSDAQPGEPIALICSDEVLEVAVRDGRAADALHVGRGGEVTVRTSAPVSSEPKD